MPTIRVRWLLLGASAFVLLSPVLALGGLRIYDVFLMRQTERQLIAQSVVIAEASRPLLLRARGEDDLGGEIRGPHQLGDRFAPIDPLIDLGVEASPPAPQASGSPLSRSQTFASLSALLRRTQTFNLTGLRVLDDVGCVVAASGKVKQTCLSHLPEVQRALKGTYTSLIRRRYSDEPAPPLGGTRRRGRMRVFSALPIFHNSEVIGVVRAVRTSLNAPESLWANRRSLVLGFGFTIVIAGLVAFVSIAAIVLPLRRITRAANQVATTGATAALRKLGWQPEEFSVLSEALLRMAEQLDGKARYIADYAANATHELKTPITGIQGAAELLSEQWETMDVAQRKRFLDNIQSGARRMSTLVGRLLELARIENSLNEPTQRIALPDFFAELGDAYGERVEVEAQMVPAGITIDPELLRSAVCNLVDNALEHSDALVSVVATEESGKLKVMVIDRGPGIAEEDQSLVFDRFFSRRRDQGGTGLGLAIVEAIAERRGGSVTFTSRPGETVFTLVL